MISTASPRCVASSIWVISATRGKAISNGFGRTPRTVSRISRTSSPGYGILNLRLAKTFSGAVRVEVGVENLLDKRYADHLGGVNRVTGGDLATGEHIPGAGRFAYASVSWVF